jgi:hypothetical protein
MTIEEIAAHNAVILRHFRIREPHPDGVGEVRRTAQMFARGARNE